MRNEDLIHWLHAEAFEHVLSNIAIIDREFKIVEANRHFEETFGPWQGRFCFDVYKRRNDPCKSCPAQQTFIDGKSRILKETGVDRHGNFAYYVVRTEAIVDPSGDVLYVIEFSENVTESKELQRAYRALFDRVPCYVQVLDRDLRIVIANEKQRETFGESEGKHCYEVYKRRETRCHPCPALKAFQDGKTHSSEQAGVNKYGQPTVYAVTAAPLSRGDDEVAHVIEISMDITDVRSLERQLRCAHALEDSLINNSTGGIIAFDGEGRLSIYNPAAEALLKLPAGEAMCGGLRKESFPPEFQDVLAGKRPSCYLEDAILLARDGEEIPVRLHGVSLLCDDGSLGWAAFIEDLRPIKRLEAEKLEAERLSAVGETVAGLAHSVKNVLQALEGGMYALRSGLEKKNEDRLQRGWQVVEKNFNKVTGLVKDFLSFSKGRLPETKMTQPNDLAREVVALYRDVAKKVNVTLTADLAPGLEPAPLDPNAIDTCLTNLLSNAIDACQMSEKGRGEVTLRTREEDGTLIFEVCDDGCGMDYDVKKRVFTTFFTTKGGGGTGLGLLTTRKIVQEHGGKIVLESQPGQGATFRIELPRRRLPPPAPPDIL
ncbi:MAG: ATP-binding protein [Candidatus Omnitrophota bacterium]